ncbi:hypothetical protein [Mycolicibacterium mucogenicum]|uniref:Uncharacterized protein n=1 Tax=Mycolicibacterium mucogenicum DSM 44124 TaxID=1226753 RepID=A0A8H2J8Z7_MYCMU|nr:hypothetical protein [Mycolicibacterium mucogenicum]KAB7761797.1 hypothetical protein MMUC44124_01215 [Mycolicibacterium mucogenicum DSM 44124]QPG70043.1 hypothetical protein C1S78_003175 [Mycolicibacterium mucogenicum DSM 44124]
MSAAPKMWAPRLRELLFATTTQPGPTATERALVQADQNAHLLSDLAASILRAVGTHRCNDCGDAITMTAAAGVAEYAAYQRWLGRHERCDEIDGLRDHLQAIRDRRAAADGRVAL